MRSCENCTKCCEGYLSGTVKNIPFYKGKPCHFVEIGVGCTIYKERPKDPCIKYSCQWLINENIPDWMKPNKINAIINLRLTEKNKIPYLEIIEAGETLNEKTITWLIDYCSKKNINFFWEKNGKTYYIGNKNFIKEIEKKEG